MDTASRRNEKNNAFTGDSEGNLGMPVHEWLVRVAERTRAEEILAILSISPIVEIRIAVADNRNTPEHILSLLAMDEDSDVRYSMAENHNLDFELLQTLAEDHNPYVAMRARQTLDRVQVTQIYHGDFGHRDLQIRRLSSG